MKDIADTSLICLALAKFLHKGMMLYFPAMMLCGFVLTHNVSAQSQVDSLTHEELEDYISELQLSGKTLEAIRLERDLGLKYLCELESTDRSIAQLLKTIHSLETLKDSLNAFRTREDLARIYVGHRYFHEALFHFGLIEKFFERQKDELQVAIIRSAIADTYVAMDSLQKAIPYYLQVEALNDQYFYRGIDTILSQVHATSLTALTRKGYAIAGLTDTSEVDFGGLIDRTANLFPLNLLNSGHRYRMLNAVNVARYYYLRCTQEENVDQIILRDALFNLAEIYRNFEQYDIAYQYLARYSLINDSLINDRRQRMIDRLAISRTAAEQKVTIRDLEKDQKITEFQNRLQNVLSFSLLFGTVIVLIGAYFTIRNYQQRFNANQIIHQQTQEINKQRITELENNVKIESMHSMIQGQEAERSRVAKDLHDSLGGLLATVKLHFDAIQSQDDKVSAMPEYRRAYTLLDDACNEVRQISNDLQPIALNKLGIVAAINDLINRAQSPDGPMIEFRHNGMKGIVDSRVSLNVFRIVQELLNNSLKHADATSINIVLTQTPDALSVVVQDNGKGYEPGNVAIGMGTENISSRVNYLKGDLSIHSVLGEGTTTQIDIPLEN